MNHKMIVFVLTIAFFPFVSVVQAISVQLVQPRLIQHRITNPGMKNQSIVTDQQGLKKDHPEDSLFSPGINPPG